MNLNTFSHLFLQYQVVAVDEYNEKPHRVYIARSENQITELAKVILIDLDHQEVYFPQMIGSYAKFMCPIRLINPNRDNIEEIQKQIEQLSDLTKINLSRIMEEKPEISYEDIKQPNIMENTIRKYIDPIKEDKNHRYKSWEHCYNAFGNKNESNDVLALHLSFYLASWGMYRGSSGLLWKDYEVHTGAIEIIKDHYNLRSKYVTELPDVKSVLLLVDELKSFYRRIEYFNGKNEKKVVNPTDTLISKIILGTSGCLPAFDRFFNLGLFQKEYAQLNPESIEKIWRIAQKRKPEIELIQNSIYTDSNFWYPPMKIIDMYYWQKGFDYDPEIKSKQKEDILFE